MSKNLIAFSHNGINVQQPRVNRVSAFRKIEKPERRESISRNSTLSQEMKEDAMSKAEDQSSGASTQDALSPRKSPSTSSSALIKKDSIKLSTLYKPILRRFRSYIRSVFDQGRKQSLYQHWSHDTYLNNTKQFMDRLRIPSELRDHDNVLRLLTIIFPCTVKYI